MTRPRGVPRAKKETICNAVTGRVAWDCGDASASVYGDADVGAVTGMVVHGYGLAMDGAKVVWLLLELGLSVLCGGACYV